MSSVTVLCPNGRRYNIKVSPNTPLLTVLEEACKKHGGSDPSQHSLKHQRKAVDLSRMFRHAGLPNNAKLELVPAQHYQAQSVKVAVQLKSGDRLQGVFPPTLSLYELITSLHGNSQWVTDDIVVVYMRREVCGEAALNTTSLRDLGVYGGSIVLRLTYREHTAMDTSSLDCPVEPVKPVEQMKPVHLIPNKPESLEVMLLESYTGGMAVMDTSDDVTCSHDAMSSLHDTTSSSHDATSSSHDAMSSSHDATSSSSDPTSSSHDTTSSSDNATSGSHGPMAATNLGHHNISSSHDLSISHEPIIKKPTDWKTRGQSSHNPIITKYDEPCDRHTLIFNMSDYTSSDTYELPDSFFDVTTNDCVAMQKDLQRQVKNLTDAPMMTAYHRQASQLAKYSRYETAVVRIQFPDHWMMQGHFRPNESLKALVKFVREHLTDPTIKFYLYTTPPKMVFTSAKPTLLQAGLVPASIVHFGLLDNQGIIIILLVSSGDMSGRGICLDEFGALKLCNIDIFHHKGTSTNFAQVHRPSWSYSRLLLFNWSGYLKSIWVTENKQSNMMALGDGPYLKPEVLEQAVTPLQADVVSVTTRGGQSPAESFNSGIIKFPSNVPPSNDGDFPVVPKLSAAPYKQATPTTTKSSGVPKWFKHSGGKKL